MPDFLSMKGTKGRDCSPRYYQEQHALKNQTAAAGEPAKFVQFTDVGTPIGGKPPEEPETGRLGFMGTEPDTKGKEGGTIDPSVFSTDNHAIRALSRYLEGKRMGPDWLHQRTERAADRRFTQAAQRMLDESLPASKGGGKGKSAQIG